MFFHRHIRGWLGLKASAISKGKTKTKRTFRIFSNMCVCGNNRLSHLIFPAQRYVLHIGYICWYVGHLVLYTYSRWLKKRVGWLERGEKRVAAQHISNKDNNHAAQAKPYAEKLLAQLDFVCVGIQTKWNVAGEKAQRKGNPIESTHTNTFSCFLE